MNRLRSVKKYWKQVHPLLPIVLPIAAIIIGLGIFITWLVPGGLHDTSFYLNIGASLVVLGVSIVIVSFLLPTLLDIITLRRTRVVQERLVDRLEQALIQWIIVLCQLMRCPDNLLKTLHPSLFGLPDKPIPERLPEEIEPELMKWFIDLRSVEVQKNYADLTPQQWQTLIMNISWGLRSRMDYFRQQLLPISVSLPELSELSFKLIELLDDLNIIPPADQPFKQNIMPVMCHDVSIIGERLLRLLKDTREILGKTR